MKKPFVAPSGPLVAYDCDDTLVMWDLPEGMDLSDDALVTVPCRGQEERCLPNEYNITLLKKFATRGHTVIVWSGGGVEYAKRWAEKLGIEKFVQIIPKVKGQNIDLAFDDWENNLAKVTVLVPRTYMTYGEPKE